MKIKLFTHTDLDGYGCAILARLVAGDDNVNISYCGYYDINEKIKAFINKKEYMKFDYIFITDISVNDEVALLIDSVQEDCEYKFYLLDHHPTAMNLSKYNWTRIQIEDSIEKVCGTSLFYETLTQYNFIASSKDLDLFVEKIKRYDTWLWHDKYNDIDAKHLNDLFKIYGPSNFSNNYIFRLRSSNLNRFELFTDIDKFLIELEENKINKYIFKKEKSMEVREKEINGKIYKFGIIIADDYISEMGNKISAKHPELDFIAIVSSLKTISYRTTKKDIDLGNDIASYYGGGGHPQTAGSQISNELKQSILDAIFF